MSFRDFTADGIPGACGTIIRTLRSRFGVVCVETIRDVRHFADLALLHQSVLLLNAEPRIQVRILLRT